MTTIKIEDVGGSLQSIERAVARIRTLLAQPNAPDILIANEYLLIVGFLETMALSIPPKDLEDARAHFKHVFENTGRAPMQ